MKGLVYALRAFFAVGLTEALSYPLAMVDRLINLFAIVATLFLAGQLVAEDGITVPLPTDYFLFAMTGLAVMQVFNATLDSFRFRIRQFQLHGVLEACVMTRARLWQILLATPSYSLTTAFLRAGTIVVVAHLIAGEGVSLGGAALALAILLFGVSSFLCLGLISACGVLLLKQGEPLTRVISLATFLFSGAFFPRELLPDWLAALAGWLPVAPTLDGIRLVLYGGGELGVPLSDSLFRMGLTTAVLAPLVLIAYRGAAKRVLRDGSLAHY